MGVFLYNKLWLVMVVSTACVVTSAEPKPTHKSRVADRVRFNSQSFFVLKSCELPVFRVRPILISGVCR